jgi:hypothetical protein
MTRILVTSPFLFASPSLLLLTSIWSWGDAFVLSVPRVILRRSSPSQLAMVLEKPLEKKLAKIEELKIASDHLVHPLQEVSSSRAM